MHWGPTDMELPGGDTECSEGPRRRGTPRGAGWGSQRGTGSGQARPESGRPKTLRRGKRAEDRTLGVGAGVGGLGRPVRGHSEVKGISTRGQGAGVWGCLGASRGGGEVAPGGR